MEAFKQRAAILEAMNTDPPRSPLRGLRRGTPGHSGGSSRASTAHASVFPSRSTRAAPPVHPPATPELAQIRARHNQASLERRHPDLSKPLPDEPRRRRSPKSRGRTKRRSPTGRPGTGSSQLSQRHGSSNSMRMDNPADDGEGSLQSPVPIPTGGGTKRLPSLTPSRQQRRGPDAVARSPRTLEELGCPSNPVAPPGHHPLSPATTLRPSLSSKQLQRSRQSDSTQPRAASPLRHATSGSALPRGDSDAQDSPAATPQARHQARLGASTKLLGSTWDLGAATGTTGSQDMDLHGLDLRAGWDAHGLELSSYDDPNDLAKATGRFWLRHMLRAHEATQGPVSRKRAENLAQYLATAVVALRKACEARGLPLHQRLEHERRVYDLVLRELTQQVAGYSASHSLLLNEVIRHYRDAIHAFPALLDAKDENIAQLEGENAGLEGDLSALRSDHAAATKEIQRLVQEVRDTRARLAQRGNDVAAMRRLLQGSSRAEAQALSDAQDLNIARLRNISQTDDKQGALMRKVRTLTEANAQLRRQADEALRKAVAAEGARTAAAEVEEDLRAQLTELRGSTEGLAAEVEFLEGEAKELRREARISTSAADEAKEACERATQQLRDLAARHEAFKHAHAMGGGTADRSGGAPATPSADAIDSKGTISGTGHNWEVEVALSSAKQQVTTLAAKLKASQAEVADKNRRLADAQRRAHNDQQEALARAIAAESSAETLQRRLVAAEAQVQSLKQTAGTAAPQTLQDKARRDAAKRAAGARRRRGSIQRQTVAQHAQLRLMQVRDAHRELGVFARKQLADLASTFDDVASQVTSLVASSSTNPLELQATGEKQWGVAKQLRKQHRLLRRDVRALRASMDNQISDTKRVLGKRLQAASATAARHKEQLAEERARHAAELAEERAEADRRARDAELKASRDLRDAEAAAEERGRVAAEERSAEAVFAAQRRVKELEAAAAAAKLEQSMSVARAKAVAADAEKRARAKEEQMREALAKQVAAAEAASEQVRRAKAQAEEALQSADKRVQASAREAQARSEAQLRASQELAAKLKAEADAARLAAEAAKTEADAEARRRVEAARVAAEQAAQAAAQISPDHPTQVADEYSSSDSEDEAEATAMASAMQMLTASERRLVSMEAKVQGKVGQAQGQQPISSAPAPAPSPVASSVQDSGGADVLPRQSSRMARLRAGLRDPAHAVAAAPGSRGSTPPQAVGGEHADTMASVKEGVEESAEAAVASTPPQPTGGQGVDAGADAGTRHVLLRGAAPIMLRAATTPPAESRASTPHSRHAAALARTIPAAASTVTLPSSRGSARTVDGAAVAARLATTPPRTVGANVQAPAAGVNEQVILTAEPPTGEAQPVPRVEASAVPAPPAAPLASTAPTKPQQASVRGGEAVMPRPTPTTNRSDQPTNTGRSRATSSVSPTAPAVVPTVTARSAASGTPPRTTKPTLKRRAQKPAPAPTAAPAPAPASATRVSKVQTRKPAETKKPVVSLRLGAKPLGGYPDDEPPPKVLTPKNVGPQTRARELREAMGQGKVFRTTPSAALATDGVPLEAILPKSAVAAAACDPSAVFGGTLGSTLGHAGKDTGKPTVKAQLHSGVTVGASSEIVFAEPGTSPPPTPEKTRRARARKKAMAEMTQRIEKLTGRISLLEAALKWQRAKGAMMRGKKAALGSAMASVKGRAKGKSGGGLLSKLKAAKGKGDKPKVPTPPAVGTGDKKSQQTGSGAGKAKEMAAPTDKDDVKSPSSAQPAKPQPAPPTESSDAESKGAALPLPPWATDTNIKAEDAPITDAWPASQPSWDHEQVTKSAGGRVDEKNLASIGQRMRRPRPNAVSPPHPEALVEVFTRQSHRSNGTRRPKSIGWVLRFIRNVYDDKAFAEQVDYQEGVQSMSLLSFVHQWASLRYGVPRLVGGVCSDLVLSASLYAPHCIEADLFMRLLIDYDAVDLTFALRVRSIVHAHLRDDETRRNRSSLSMRDTWRGDQDAALAEAPATAPTPTSPRRGGKNGGSGPNTSSPVRGQRHNDGAIGEEGLRVPVEVAVAIAARVLPRGMNADSFARGLVTALVPPLPDDHPVHRLLASDVPGPADLDGLTRADKLVAMLVPQRDDLAVDDATPDGHSTQPRSVHLHRFLHLCVIEFRATRQQWRWRLRKKLGAAVSNAPDGRISLDEFMACTDATSSGDELEVGNKHGKLLPGEASFAFAEALRVSRGGAAHKAQPQQGRVPVAMLVHVWSTVHARLSVLPALSYHMPDASAVANRNTMASRMRALVDHLNSAWPWQHHTERLADDNPASPMAQHQHQHQQPPRLEPALRYVAHIVAQLHAAGHDLAGPQPPGVAPRGFTSPGSDYTKAMTGTPSPTLAMTQHSYRSRPAVGLYATSPTRQWVNQAAPGGWAASTQGVAAPQAVAGTPAASVPPSELNGMPMRISAAGTARPTHGGVTATTPGPPLEPSEQTMPGSAGGTVPASAASSAPGTMPSVLPTSGPLGVLSFAQLTPQQRVQLVQLQRMIVRPQQHSTLVPPPAAPASLGASLGGRGTTTHPPLSGTFATVPPAAAQPRQAVQPAVAQIPGVDAFLDDRLQQAARGGGIPRPSPVPASQRPEQRPPTVNTGAHRGAFEPTEALRLAPQRAEVSPRHSSSPTNAKSRPQPPEADRERGVAWGTRQPTPLSKPLEPEPMPAQGNLQDLMIVRRAGSGPQHVAPTVAPPRDGETRMSTADSRGPLGLFDDEIGARRVVVGPPNSDSTRALTGVGAAAGPVTNPPQDAHTTPPSTPQRAPGFHSTIEMTFDDAQRLAASVSRGHSRGGVDLRLHTGHKDQGFVVRVGGNLALPAAQGTRIPGQPPVSPPPRLAPNFNFGTVVFPGSHTVASSGGPPAASLFASGHGARGPTVVQIRASVDGVEDEQSSAQGDGGAKRGGSPAQDGTASRRSATAGAASGRATTQRFQRTMVDGRPRSDSSEMLMVMASSIAPTAWDHAQDDDVKGLRVTK